VHAVTLNEDKKGSGIKSYYYILPGPLAIITLVGYDGKIVKVPIKSDPDVYYLNYGKSNSGDFILENPKGKSNILRKKDFIQMIQNKKIKYQVIILCFPKSSKLKE